VRGAGLTTLVLQGPGTNAAAQALRGLPGVDQVAPYGATLHVVGRDGAALRQSATTVASATGCTLTEADTSLEDVFIQLMGRSQDNMA